MNTKCTIKSLKNLSVKDVEVIKEILDKVANLTNKNIKNMAIEMRYANPGLSLEHIKNLGIRGAEAGRGLRKKLIKGEVK